MTSPRRSSFPAALFALLSSMRFAVSLLTVLAITSIIGTVLRQNEAPLAYIAEFGDFWQMLFDAAGLFDIYHATPFLLILLFLIISIGLCIWRQTPSIWRDLKSWHLQTSDDSLRHLAQHREYPQTLDPVHVRIVLEQHGFQLRETLSDGRLLLAGRKGRFNKAGYFFAHAAIVVICIGGLLDGNLLLKWQEIIGLRIPEVRDLPQSEVPSASRLAASNPAFRGNVTIAEGSSADVIFMNTAKGYYVQELPFVIHLKRFTVEHYASGQPKRFMSEIDLLNRSSGKLLRSAEVEVNKPLRHDGIAIYQASFGDGGSPLALQQYPLDRPGVAQALNARSQTSQALDWHGQRYKLEVGDFRLFNIEQQAPKTASVPADLLAKAQSVRPENHARNFGPSIQFKLRDDAGQAVEFLNYLAPLAEDGALYQLTGSRKFPNDPFSFTRIPLDAAASPTTFLRLRTTLLDKTLHPEIARRTAAKAEAGGGVSQQSREQFRTIVLGALDRFASGGFPAIDQFLAQKVPQEQRQAVAQTYIKVLQGAVIDAMDVAQGKSGLPLLPVDEQQYRFLLDSLVASSTLQDYGAPFWLQLTGFEEVKASGLQLTRAPGKKIVYLGMLLLILGVYCLFYIRELRCWIRITPHGSLFALSANRKNDDLVREFNAIATALTEENHAR